MPVHSCHTAKAGTTGKMVFVVARQPDGRPRVGLRAADGRAAFIREGNFGATPIELAKCRLGEWTPGGFVEVNQDLMPGTYQLGVPDELLQEGTQSALLLLSFADAVVAPIRFTLVAYDPQDESCIGLGQLQDHMRHQFLRRALPRLTEMELEQGRDTERRLSASLDEAPTSHK